ncbi:uracil-DNA glycosylase family protein [Capnocytophaga periodontitidis]|uniref:uracil-DNA glycosylase family protein n=1 Tax=Capnocytophaga periodontitidis TaxID=2795027 RepID=UPI0018E1B7F3|nr:uracil-DNA glycosylase family protein [Capnocytophaga periodontitidis]MBI1668957.1 uracil-DNA glycosylase [Capnocytophaga periodontitidis]
MSKFVPELEQWAAEVIEKITPIAEQIDLAYYPLQTEAKMNPELLIIGLNPRAVDEKEARLDSQKNNSIWEFKDGKMSTERLLKGNPCYSEKDTWTVIKGIENINFVKRSIESGNYCFMNYIFFSTKDENTLKGLKNFKLIEDTCVDFTKKIVDIINPKQIIVLGVTASDKLVTNKKTILQSNNARLVVEGNISGRKVFAIYHPSRLKSYLDKNIINKYLSELLEGKKVTPINLNNKINIQNVLSVLKEKGFEFTKLPKGEYYKFITKGLNDDELDFRIDLQDKIPYIAFRSSNQKDFLNLNATDFYLEHFPKAETTPHWIGRKNLYVYSENNVDQEVISDLLSLLNAIKAQQ